MKGLLSACRPSLRWIFRAAIGLLAIANAAAEDFYQGKTLTVVVPSSPGGGYDTNTRLLARHVGSHIPGNPTIVVKNLPGAGGLAAVRSLTTSSTDGTTLVGFQFGLIGQSVFDPEQMPIDFRKFAWIGSISEDYALCFVRSGLGVSSIDQLRSLDNVNFGVSGIGGNDDIYARIIRDFLGVKLKQIHGYPGTAEVGLAMQGAEVDGSCYSWGSFPYDWFTDNAVKFLFRARNSRPPPALSPNVPYLLDLLPDDRARSIVQELTADRAVGRPFIVSANVPSDRIEILRDAFDATVKDPEFLADAAKMNIPISPKTGDEALNTVKSMYDAPRDVIEAVRSWLSKSQ